MDTSCRSTVEIKDEIPIVHIAGAVELTSVGQIESRIENAIANCPSKGIIVDLAEVPFVDSSGLGLFLNVAHRHREGRGVRFCRLSPQVAAVFEYVGVRNHLDFDPSIEASVAALSETSPGQRSAQKEKSRRLAIAAKYLLNDAGQKYCNQLQIPVRDLQLQDGSRATGFDWKSCDVGLLRKLVIYGLVTSIEIARPEFVSARSELIGLVRGILEGMLIKRFRAELKRRLRLNPEAARLAEDSAFVALVGNSAAIASALRERAIWVEGLRVSIEEDCAGRIRAASEDGSCEDEDRKHISDLLDAIDDETALILVLGGVDLAGIAMDVVYSYTRRMEIAEHLCLMLMEFVQMAEKAFFLNLAERDLYVRNHPEELESLLSEAEFRDRLLKHAAQRQELMTLTLNFTGTIPDPVAPSVVEITVRNRGLIGYASRKEVIGRKLRVVRESSIDEILAAEAEGGSLGLIYHTLLAESCAAEGMSFQSTVLRDEAKDETVAILTLTL